MKLVSSGQASQTDWDLIAGAATVLRYQLHIFQEQVGGENQVIVALAERGGSRRKHRGIFLFRMGEAETLQIHVPRPYSESGTLGYGLALFAKTRARSLLIAGPGNPAGIDPVVNRSTLFNLV